MDKYKCFDCPYESGYCGCGKAKYNGWLHILIVVILMIVFSFFLYNLIIVLDISFL